MRNFCLCICKRRFNFQRLYSVKSPRVVLGIETSCDDTGAAVVDENRNILGEGFNSQMKIHLENGGVIPHIAQYFHEKAISTVVSTALEQSGLTIHDVSAFAATAKPGLKASLRVGLEYGKMLAKQASKPFIPIHHMEAHSLTIRMVEDVTFPFLVLLASGGHCQLAVVKNINEFLLLGTSYHNSPGEILDKIARRLKLQNLPECSEMCGGKAIDFMAEGGDPYAYKMPHPLVHYRDCNFSFSSFASFATDYIEEEEARFDLPPDGVIPGAKNLCASVLNAFALHITHRVQRAILFCEQTNIWTPEQRTLVFSGGVACNKYLRNALKNLCDSFNCRFACPPPKLCTDNGIMIAWNGMERLKANIGSYENFDHIQPESNCPLGTDITEDVKKASIKVKIGELKMKEKQTMIV